MARRRIFNGISSGTAACVAIGSLVLAGCGGGNGSTGASAPAGPPLSKQQLVSQANAVCKDVNDKTKALTPPSDLPSLASVASEEITNANEGSAKLGALTPPAELQAKYSQWLSDVKAQTGLAGELEAAAKAGDSAKVQDTIKKLQSANAHGDAEARALGLTECARDVQPQG